MKKILLILVIAAASLGLSQNAKAQCSGATVLITNVSFNTSATHYIYQFNWTYVSGNASIQVRFRCGGTYIADGPCIPWLKDSAAGPHFVKDSFLISSVPCAQPALKEIIIGIWTSNQCNGHYCPSAQNITLPVKFASFNAVRNRSNVNITWSTAGEFNNAGFAVERNTGGSWEQIGYVPTQAVNGSSDATLNYSFTDLSNNVKGITQYRVRQIDIDNKSSYTEIKSVRGENQLGKVTVYPNPSADGKVNVVFDDANVVRNVSVMDMSGRMVKEYRSISNNNLTIVNLQPGMYTVKIAVPETGEQVVQKIVVNKR